MPLAPQLSAQVICAMFGNPLEASIDLPKQKQWSAVEMLSDHFAGKSGDTDLAEFASLVAGLAAKPGTPAAACVGADQPHR